MHMLEIEEKHIVVNIEDVRTPMKVIFKILVKIDSSKVISLKPEM